MAARIANQVGGVSEKLSGASHKVTNWVKQLSDAGTGLSQASAEAAASLEETVASLEELTSMVQLNSGNARQAAELSNSSCESAQKGEQEIRGLIDSMNEISVSSKKIEEIIFVVDDISFQTNLLALNAAVEAARAGEQGKGFAVVAEAVRSLAQRSAEASKDIATLIRDSVDKIDKANYSAKHCGDALGGIVGSVRKVLELNEAVAAASKEQASGLQQINIAMNQLDRVSQSNAASAEQISATSTEINHLSTVTLVLSEDLSRVVDGTAGDEVRKRAA